VEVLSPLDAAFLRLEDRSTSLHIASVAIFDGPPPAYEDMYAAFEAKLHLVPRYRQRVREVPLRLGRPVWVDDPHFSLRYHLRHTALPRPGTAAQLRDLVGRLMSQQLDRGKPLWETWIVDGLEGGRWAVVSKIHHCMVDGIAGTDLLGLVLDLSPDAPLPDTPPPPLQPEPGVTGLLLAAASSVPHSPVAAVRTVARAVASPGATARSALTAAHGALSFARLAWPAAASSLVGPLTPHRAWGWTGVPLDDVRIVRRGLGGTVNDVVLTAITRGFRDLLLARGETPDEHVVRTLVPVSVRHEDARGVLDNRVSAMIAELPVELSEPAARLAAVRLELGRLKRSGEPQFGELVTAAAALVPAPLLSLGLTGAFRVPHRHLVTVTTNVPGPQVPLYACGRRLREYYPYVPIADRVRIGVAITSYDGVLGFGVTADQDSTPDVQVLLDGINAEIEELVALAGGRPPDLVVDLTEPIPGPREAVDTTTTTATTTTV
jgi:WS/DGAT/MGAT family acyltransferase